MSGPNEIDNKNPQPRRPVTAGRAAPQRGWVCGHAELGQCCEAGPTRTGCCSRTSAPCIPRRSHWSTRSGLRTNLAILTGGVLLLALVLPSREKHFVPGELSGKHAQILENTLVSQRCGLCHPASHTGGQVAAFAQTLKQVVQRQLGSGEQDALCMQCHRGHMPNAANRSPHDLSAADWARLTSVSNEPSQVNQTACAACHVEHHGRGFDLKSMADDRCQACHRRKFESFSVGHPEFANFPPARVSALAFSHQWHSSKHFPQKGRDFDCRQCHLETGSATGSRELSRSVSFERACAECHREPIRAATIDGWAVLELPSIDAQAAEKDADLAHWPAGARFGFDGFISPVLRALLMADPGAQRALERLPEGGRLSEIPAADPGRREVTLALARATEKLIDESAREGQPAWRGRLETVTRARLGRELGPHEQQLIEAMCSGLPPDLFRQIRQRWFESAPAIASTTTAPTSDSAESPGGTVHRLVATTEDDLLLTPPAQGDSGGDLLESSQDDLLSGEPDSLLSDTPLSTAESSQEAPSKKASPLKGAVHVSAGGWYVDDQTLAVRYMPTGHADPTLAAWNLWWKIIEPNASGSDGAQASANQIPGGCLECHRLPDTSTGSSELMWSLADAWKIVAASGERKEFTKFDHGPHLSLPAINDCRYCHVLPATSATQSQPAAPLTSLERLVALRNPESIPAHGPEFETMRLAQCVACHRPGGANDSCLQCHNYHIDSVPERPAGH